MIDPIILRTRLMDRGIRVGAPATDAEIAILQAATGAELHPHVAEVYRAFNGFSEEDFDASSEIGVWQIQKIKSSDREYFLGGMMPFADFSLDLMVFIHSPSDPTHPVVSYFDGRQVSPSLHQFWNDLLQGKFDVVRPRRS